MSREGVLVLGGQTAAGKTALAVALAARYDAEIVGADSRQIYRGMPIGTAAPSDVERAGIPYHLTGFLDPHERYSAARFAADAVRTIAGIHARGKRAIVAGGTGFYLRALCGDVTLAPAFEPALRARLEREARLHPPEVLHAWLAARDAARAAALAPGDGYRIARALEIALAPRATAADVQAQPSLRALGYRFLKVALDVDQLELERRIEARVDAMLAQGFVAEAERIGPRAVAANAVGYPHALAYLDGFQSERELRAQLLRATRRYAKRQRTWFRHEPGMPALSAERIDAMARESLGWT